MNRTVGTLVSPSVGGTYAHLRDGAVRLLSDSPDGLDDVTLACALFGALTGDRWHLLLASVLAGDPRLRHDGGRWCLATHTVQGSDRQIGPIRQTASTVPGPAGQPSDVPPDEASLADPAGRFQVMALALSTTGADPRRHRVMRIAVVQRGAGEVTARFDVELGGEWRSRWRGQPEADLDSGEGLPSFADVLPDLLDLVRDQTVYAYGARRTWAFLDAERRRSGLPELNIRLRELDERIREIVPGSKKPGLLAVAEELGIPELSSTGRSSALGEADLVARVLERLHDRQAASPGRAALAGDVARSTEPGWADLPFTHEWLTGIPEGPGVYVVEDAAANALYVGKAVALRKRLSAYVSKPLSRHRRFEALGVRAAKIRTVDACSDLEATLLEAWLIRQRQPAFNTARTVREAATVVRAAPDDSTPRVHLVGEPRSDGARYFGPFESATAARQALEAARAVYPAAFERRRGDVPAQRQAVLAVVQLLAGQKDASIELVRQLMSDAAATADRPEVDRLRATLRGIQDLTIRASVLIGLPDGWRLLALERIAETGLARLHLIQDGHLLRSVDTERSTLPSRPRELLALGEAMLSEVRADDSDDAEESWTPADSAIVMRWLVHARQRVELARVPAFERDDEA